MYDPIQGVYHMHYQFHPNHVNWGMNIVPYLMSVLNICFYRQYLVGTCNVIRPSDVD